MSYFFVGNRIIPEIGCFRIIPVFDAPESFDNVVVHEFLVTYERASVGDGKVHRRIALSVPDPLPGSVLKFGAEKKGSGLRGQ